LFGLGVGKIDSRDSEDICNSTISTAASCTDRLAGMEGAYSAEEEEREEQAIYRDDLAAFLREQAGLMNSHSNRDAVAPRSFMI